MLRLYLHCLSYWIYMFVRYHFSFPNLIAHFILPRFLPHTTVNETVLNWLMLLLVCIYNTFYVSIPLKDILLALPNHMSNKSLSWRLQMWPRWPRIKRCGWLPIIDVLYLLSISEYNRRLWLWFIREYNWLLTLSCRNSITVYFKKILSILKRQKSILFSSSCLHRASIVWKHFLLLQLMHIIIKS